MPVKGLKRAERLFRLKKFKEVINLLQPEIFKYRNNYHFYIFLGLSSLYTNEPGGALSYLNRAHDLNGNDVDVLNGIAAAHLLKYQSNEALKVYLNALEIDPGNAIAKKGLELIRKGLETDALVNLIGTGKIRKLFPRVGSFPFRYVMVTLAIMIVAGMIGVMIPFLFRGPKVKRPEIARYMLPEDSLNLTDPELDERFQLTPDQIRVTFEKAKNLFNDFEDNPAIVELNRILNSNASYPVKNLCRIMKKYAVKPDFSTIRNSFPLNDVLREPVLYNNCSVVWKGKVGSLEISDDAIRFMLWVGDDAEFEGVVPVTFDSAVDIAKNQTMEVLGEVIVAEGKVTLKGNYIHRIY